MPLACVLKFVSFIFYQKGDASAIAKLKNLAALTPTSRLGACDSSPCIGYFLTNLRRRVGSKADEANNCMLLSLAQF
jgi:hypothetical protein